MAAAASGVFEVFITAMTAFDDLYGEDEAVVSSILRMCFMCYGGDLAWGNYFINQSSKNLANTPISAI